MIAYEENIFLKHQRANKEQKLASWCDIEYKFKQYHLATFNKENKD